MKALYLSLLTLLIFTKMAFAGTANAFIECKSASGRTVVEADFPVDEETASLKITVDGKTSSYVNEATEFFYKEYNKTLDQDFPNAKVTKFASGKDKSGLSITAFYETDGKSDDVQLTLRSVGPLKSKRLPNGEQVKFTGIVNGWDPRKADTLLPAIKLACVYTYSL